MKDNNRHRGAFIGAYVPKQLKTDLQRLAAARRVTLTALVTEILQAETDKKKQKK